jgi:hypothetical protein
MRLYHATERPDILRPSMVAAAKAEKWANCNFIFYSIFEVGITGYRMHEEGSDLQFIPLSDLIRY